MKDGDNIYYADDAGSAWPGIVLAQKRAVVLIEVNHEEDDWEIWVLRSALRLQYEWMEEFAS